MKASSLPRRAERFYAAGRDWQVLAHVAWQSRCQTITKADRSHSRFRAYSQTMRARYGFLVLLLAAPVLAEPETAASKERTWRRELAGHVFVPSLTVTDPFVSTFVNVNTGAGYAWIDGPGFDVRGGQVGSESYVAAAIAEAVSFQANLTKWLAIRLGGAGGLNSGFNARSAFVVGMVQPITIGAGATASWQLGRLVRLGGTLDFVYSYTKLIQPLAAVQSSLVASQVDTSRVSQQFNGYSILPGAAVAIAPHRSIGLLGSAHYLWNGFYSDATSLGLNYVVLGVSAQLDLRPFWARAPVGFLLSYRAQIPFESNVRFTHTLEGGFFYTGRKELDLGLDVQLRWFDLRPDSRIPLDTLQLVGIFLIRYHWN